MNDIFTTAKIETENIKSWKLLPKFSGTKVFQQLIDNEFKDPEELEAKTVNALKRLLEYSIQKIPYYRKQFETLGLKPGSIERLSDLEDYPLLSRFDLVNHFDELHPSGIDINDKKFNKTRTTGSTGLPVTVLQSSDCASMFPVLWQRLPRWFRLDLNKRFARIRIPPDLFKLEGNRNNPDGNTVGRPQWMHSGLFFETGDEIHFNVGNPRQAQLDWIERFRPAYLLTFPGLMEELALANKCQRLPAVERLIAVSSILTSAMRARIVQAFNIPINQTYGLNEIGLVATRCAAGSYHVNTEHAHVEIVDGEGKAAAAGDSGRILITSLNNSAMPLIRYDTGDLATVSTGTCPCGRTQPAFENILGRYIRFAGTPDGTRPRLNGLLKELAAMPNEMFTNILQYQIRQLANQDFELHLVAKGPLHHEFCDQLTQKWERLNTDGEVWGFSVHRVDKIEVTPSGKQLDFVSAFHELDADFDK